MTQIIKNFLEFINNFHDLIVHIVQSNGFNLIDKQLHFIVMAIIGIIIFILTDFVFKFISRYSITMLSFIYTFSAMVVIVLAIEVEQMLTNRGKLDLMDAAYGMYGFLSLFFSFVFLKAILRISRFCSNLSFYKLNMFVLKNDVDVGNIVLSKNKLKLLQEKIGLTFGKQLKKYLLTYGYLAFNDIEFYGITAFNPQKSNLIMKTQYLHEHYPDTQNFIMFKETNENTYILVNKLDEVFTFSTKNNSFHPVNLKLFDFILIEFKNTASY